MSRMTTSYASELARQLALLAVRHEFDCPALLLQPALHVLPDGGIVFDDQDAHALLDPAGPAESILANLAVQCLGAMMPSTLAARPWCQFVSCRTVSMCRRSSSAREIAGAVARSTASATAAAAADPMRGSAAPFASSTARSITFLQLAHVARPRILPQQRRSHRRRASAGCALPNCGRKSLREQRDVRRAIAQRRQLDRDRVDAIEQVVAESAVAHAAARSWLVAATMRTSTSTFCVPPTRKKLSPARARASSLPCSFGEQLADSRR